MAGGLYKDGKKIAEITEISVSGPGGPFGPGDIEILHGMTAEEFRKQYMQEPAPSEVGDCPKSSCQRHGACMYLNHPRCPFNRLNMATDLRKD
jgi:hypothetical protein